MEYTKAKGLQPHHPIAFFMEGHCIPNPSPPGLCKNGMPFRVRTNAHTIRDIDVMFLNFGTFSPPGRQRLNKGALVRDALAEGVPLLASPTPCAATTKDWTRGVQRAILGEDTPPSSPESKRSKASSKDYPSSEEYYPSSKASPTARPKARSQSLKHLAGKVKQIKQQMGAYEENYCSPVPVRSASSNASGSEDTQAL